MADLYASEPCTACDGTGERYSVERYPGTDPADMSEHWQECEECDGYGISCTTESRRAYLALVAMAEKIGWPECYKRDLTFHDRTSLAGRDPDLPFAWMVRETGTAICLPEEENARTWKIAEHAVGGLGQHRVFWWNGKTLVERTGSECEELFMMEVRRYERLQGRKAA